MNVNVNVGRKGNSFNSPNTLNLGREKASKYMVAHTIDHLGLGVVVGRGIWLLEVLETVH